MSVNENGAQGWRREISPTGSHTYSGLHRLRETSPDFLNEVVTELSRARAEGFEHRARAAAIARLPRPLRRAVDHPRILRLLYRLRPAWRPTAFYIEGSTADPHII